MYMLLKKLVVYNIKINLKVLTCFGMIWNYEKISKQNTKSSKIYALSKICISPNLIIKKKWHIGANTNTMYKKFQNISFENSSLGKHVFWEKRSQKGQ
jgi:hypothetical protein